MSIPTDVGVSRYTGNGATSTFNVGFHFKADADLTVIVTNTSDTDTTLTLNTHYTVSGAGDTSGGSITLISSYANLTDGYSLTIILDPDKNISTSFRNSGPITGAQLQTVVDKLSQGLINLQTQVDRCVKLPWKETPTAAKTQLPDSTDRTSKNFTFDSSGNPSATTSVATGSLDFTTIGETIAEAANAGAVLDALGFSTFGKTQIDDANAAAGRATLGIDGASGVIAAGDLASNAVTTAKITDANVTAIKLANDAVAHLFQARLTLTSATPVTTSDVSSAGTIYLTPYKGNKLALYNGTIWKLHTLTEISLALTATSGKVYDVWVYDNSGTLTLETTEWTNTTTRATALATQDGVYCKTGALTRRYVGTFYASGSNVTNDSLAKRHLFNYYNRARRLMKVRDETQSWDYTTADGRQANDSAANQLDFVCGVEEDVVNAELLAASSNTNANVQRTAWIGLDGLTGTHSTALSLAPSMGNTPASEIASSFYSYSATHLGRHYLTWVEYSAATGTTTWYGSNAFLGIESGIQGWIWC